MVQYCVDLQSVHDMYVLAETVEGLQTPAMVDQGLWAADKRDKDRGNGCQEAQQLSVLNGRYCYRVRVPRQPDDCQQYYTASQKKYTTQPPTIISTAVLRFQ